MNKLPLTVKRSVELLGLFLLGALFLLGGEIIMPLLMAFLFSIVLLPVYRFLRRRKVPEIPTIFLSILLLIVFLGLIIWFFSLQTSTLISDFPQIKQNIITHLRTFSSWIDRKTHFTTSQQLAFFNEQSESMLQNAGTLLGTVANSITSFMAYVGLVPIYIFMILLYKNLFLRFVFLWFNEDVHDKVKEVLRETEIILKSYLLGLLIQITYMSILLGGILWLIGIERGWLIGILFAFLNLIPYVGGFIGIIVGVLLTISSTQEVWPILAVLGTIAFVQFLDNNILMPRIVGSKVKINALATIAGVVIGGKLAGIAGMFLSLPILATLKVIFDRTPSFYQWGVLLGEEVPKESPMHAPILRKGSRQVQKKLENENDVEPPHA